MTIFGKFQINLAWITGTLCTAIYVFLSLVLCSITSFRKSCHLSDNVEKYERARQATHDNIIAAQEKMQFACRITKARIKTHTSDI